MNRRAPFAARLIANLAAPGGVALDELLAAGTRLGGTPEEVRDWLDRLHHNGWLYRLPRAADDWGPERFRLTAHAIDHLDHDHRRSHVTMQVA